MSPISLKNRALLVGFCCLAIVLPITDNCAQTTDQPVNPPDDGLIVISTSEEQLDLSSDNQVLPLSSSEAAPQYHATFRVDAVPWLPQWEVFIAAESLLGTSGPFPPGKIWVRTVQTGGQFLPLDTPIMVLAGDDADPVMASDVAVSVRPDWTDRAGDYRGRLVLCPGTDGHGSGWQQQWGRDDPPGGTREVVIRFSIPEVIQLSVAESVISFNAAGVPGSYPAGNDLTLGVATNASRWKIVCHPSDFRHATDSSRTVPMQRVHWTATTNQPNDRPRSGPLHPNTTILRGNGPVRDLVLTLSFTVETRPSDPAGNYTLSITLTGEVDR